MPNRNAEFLSPNFKEFTLKTNNQILELQPNIKYIFGRSPQDSKQFPPGFPNIAYINLLPNGRQNFSLDRVIMSIYSNSAGITIEKYKTPNLVSFTQKNAIKNPENYLFSDYQQVIRPDFLHQLFIVANDTFVTTLTHSINPHHQSILTVNFNQEYS